MFYIASNPGEQTGDYASTKAKRNPGEQTGDYPSTKAKRNPGEQTGDHASTNHHLQALIGKPQTLYTF